MFGSPLPPLPAGSSKLPGLLAVLLVVGTRHIDTILLYVVTMIAESVNALLIQFQTSLYQLIVLIVAQSQCSIKRTRQEEVDVLGKAHPFVVQMFLETHDDGQLPETDTPDAHFGALLRQRVFASGRNDDHPVVHRRLENIHQRKASIHNLYCLAQLQRSGLRRIRTDTAHGGLGD